MTRRHRWSARSARDISDGRPSRSRRVDGPRTRGARPPALSDVRQRGRRKVHAHRSTTLRSRPDPDGSTCRAEESLGREGDNPSISLTSSMGLEAEQEQGITIDVAYRYFSTPRRSFIVADAPGHEQYTRNMATGASGSDLAVLLIDARKGVINADATSLAHRVAIRCSPRSAGGEQDGSGGVLARGLPGDRKRVSGIRQGLQFQQHRRDSRPPQQLATTWPGEAIGCRGITGPR